jgi:long-chain acyl-CoA synthetase
MGDIYSGKRRISSEDLGTRAARAAAGLASLGVGVGDTVAIYMRNDFAFYEASLAAGQVGAYSVPANWHQAEEEARYFFEDSGAKVIVVHADLVPSVKGAFPESATVLVVSTPDEIGDAYAVPAERRQIPTGMMGWNEWLNSFEPARKSDVVPPGAMIYTSGTTGRPKGVRRLAPTKDQAASYANILIRAFGFLDAAQLRPVTVVTGPMYHSAPNQYGLLAARLGGDVILQPRFDAEDLLYLIEHRRVTHLHVVPIMFNRLLKLPNEVRSKYDLSSLRHVVHSAAPVSPPIKRAMIEWWGPIIHEYYGTTETGMLTYCSTEEWLQHPGTVGKPFSETALAILDQHRCELPAGEVGEIAGRIRTTSNFTYHRDPAKREQVNWNESFVSGDIGYLDSEGFLFLCDRTKDLIISGGVNIYPAEIEGQLHKMPGVVDCAVFGVPDEEYGEAVYAVVQTNPEAGLTSDQVRQYLRGRVAGYKVPKLVEFRSELPREDSGKIFKRRLRDPFWSHAGRQI